MLSALCLSTAQTALADWNTDTAKNNQVTPTNVEMYDPEMITTSDGYTYCYFIVPGQTLNYRIQIMDPDGNRVLKTAGLTLSKEESNTWTKVNYPTTLDNDGNLILAVQDMRNRNDELNQTYLYTLFKVNRQGDVLWTHSLNDSVPSYDNAHITLSVANDNTLYAAFAEVGVGYTTRYLHIERLDEMGHPLWSQPLTMGGTEGVNYYYPTVKALTDGSALVCFLNTDSYEYQCMKVNSDASLAWDEPRTIYSGSYGSSKVWDCLSVSQLTDSTFAFMTLTEGKTSVLVCFDQNGNRLTYEDESTPICNVSDYGIAYDDLCYDPDEEVLNISYRQIDLSSSYHHGIYVQQMGVQGDWYFEDEGHPLIAMQDTDQYAYSRVRRTNNSSEMAIFYIMKETRVYTSPAQCYMAKMNYDAEVTMEPVAFTSSANSKSSLWVSDLLEDSYYLVSWLEKRGTASSESIYMQRVYVNGSVESAISQIRPDQPTSEGSFDLMGRQTTDLQSGLQIRNGRICFVR